VTNTSEPSPPVELVRTADGTQLAVRRRSGDGSLIVALHGFTGDGTTMLNLVDQCRMGRPALLIDLVGHGASDAPEHVEMYAMSSVVDQVLSVVGPHEPGSVHLIGYSMGGRVALSVAARAPWFFASISTISATAGIDDPIERAARYDADMARADELERMGVDEFIDAWLELDLFAPFIGSLDEGERRATERQRKSSTALGLANSLRGTGTGSMPPVWAALASVRSPLLAVAGSLDSRYVAVAQRLADVAMFGRSHVVEGVGHVAHHENCRDVGSRIAEFLEVCENDEDSLG